MTPAERCQAWAALLNNAGERTFPGGGGFIVNILGVEVVDLPKPDGDTATAVKISFRVRKAGVIVLEDDWVAFGPPVAVEDGTEANPLFDALNPRSKPLRTVFRQDVRAAMRQHFMDVMTPIIRDRSGQ